MKKALSFLLLLIGTATIAQNSVHKRVTDTFIIDFNNGDLEQIYQTFSPEMKKARTKKYYFDFLKKIKSGNGKLLQLELNKYSEKSGKSRGSYNGRFEYRNCDVRISTNAKGEIVGLYIMKQINL